MPEVNWPSDKQFLAFAVGLIAVLLLAGCAHDPKRLTHSPQFVACREMCMDSGAADALVLEKTEGLACVCVKQPDRT